MKIEMSLLSPAYRAGCRSAMTDNIFTFERSVTGISKETVMKTHQIPLIFLAPLFASSLVMAQNNNQTQPVPAQTESPSAQVEAPAADTTQPAEGTDMAAFTTAGKIINEQTEQQRLTSNLVGLNVKNAQDENIAEVSDLIVDENNTLVGAVLSVGGFLGIGDKHIAVGLDQLELNEVDGEWLVRADLSKEQLEAAPEFVTLDEKRAEEEALRAQQQMQQTQPLPPAATQ
jgi:hypothetical protein